MAKGNSETFESYIASEHERLSKEREEALAQREEAEQKLRSIDRQARAMQVYRDTLEGKGERRTTTRRRGELRGEKLQSIFELIRNIPDGLSRGDILRAMRANDKSSQQSISNALSALTLTNQLGKICKRYVTA